MSDHKPATSDDSIVHETGASGSETVIRRAAVRQHTEDVPAALPEEGQVAYNGLPNIFNDDGDLEYADDDDDNDGYDPSRPARSQYFDGEPQPVAQTSVPNPANTHDSLDAFDTDGLSWALFDYHEIAYRKWVAACDENTFPDKSRREVLLDAWNAALGDNDDSLQDAIDAGILPTPDGDVFEITVYQQGTDDKTGASMPSAADIKAAILQDNVDHTMVDCPDCDNGSLQKEGRQMGAADEGQTVFAVCDCCDYTAKGGYGG